MKNPWEFVEALCREIGTEQFFLEENEDGRPTSTDNYTMAKRICKMCAHQNQCLQWALDNDEQYGIWGGTTPKQRRELRRARRINLKVS